MSDSDATGETSKRYRIRVTRGPTARFGSASWDMLDSHMRPLELRERLSPADMVRTAVEEARFPGETLTFECYELTQ